MLRSNNFSIFYFCLITSFISGITCSSVYSSSKCESKKYSYNFPQDSGRPCYCDRFTPIALDTSRAKPIKVPELKIVFSNDAILTTNNTGERVESVLVQGNITMTGGCLLNKVYNFTQSLYNIDAVPQFTRTSGFYDGIGYPITHSITWTKLGLTEDEGFLEPDGFCSMSIPVKVEGNKNNTKFWRYASVLEKIRLFNTTTNSSAYDVLGFLFDALPNNCYYCYPGSRNAPVTDELLPVSIHIDVSPRIIPVISYYQYEQVYLKVLDPNNQTFVKVGACYEEGNRPVVEICDPTKVNYNGNGGAGGGCH